MASGIVTSFDLDTNSGVIEQADGTLVKVDVSHVVSTGSGFLRVGDTLRYKVVHRSGRAEARTVTFV